MRPPSSTNSYINPCPAHVVSFPKQLEHPQSFHGSYHTNGIPERDWRGGPRLTALAALAEDPSSFHLHQQLTTGAPGNLASVGTHIQIIKNKIRPEKKKEIPENINYLLFDTHKYTWLLEAFWFWIFKKQCQSNFCISSIDTMNIKFNNSLWHLSHLNWDLWEYLSLPNLAGPTHTAVPLA